MAIFKSKLHAVWSNAPSGKAPGGLHALNTAYKPFQVSVDAPNWRVKRPLRLDRTVPAAARGLLDSHHQATTLRFPAYLFYMKTFHCGRCQHHVFFE
ncbi:MAG TPA: hypothetical protein VKJ77_23840, partial [Caballeronia sp.]|nr:hypothetical protein [Caballeronia sp.]